MNYKYIVLDFGKVIVGPTTGDWDMTPKFKELIDIDSIDYKRYKELRNKYGEILSENVTTLEEEYDMFYRFYSNILRNFNIEDDISKTIAYDRTYSYDKYRLYSNIHNELELLKKKYKLILLTDNWPDVYDYLKEYDLDKYFDKVYVSSIYGVEKKDKVFFDYPINDFNISKNEALFIDDNESNLDIAITKGFDVLLTDRNKDINESKYKIINNLSII